MMVSEELILVKDMAGACDTKRVVFSGPRVGKYNFPDLSSKRNSEILIPLEKVRHPALFCKIFTSSFQVNFPYFSRKIFGIGFFNVPVEKTRAAPENTSSRSITA